MEQYVFFVQMQSHVSDSLVVESLIVVINLIIRKQMPNLVVKISSRFHS